MVKSERPDPDADPFRPPEIPIEVGCLHCGRTYESYCIEWREEPGEKDQRQGFWCCPTPGCGGVGFGFDILPTDPNYRDERGGWVCCDGDEDDDDYDQEEDFEDDFQPPARPRANHKSNGNGDGRTIDDLPF